MELILRRFELFVVFNLLHLLRPKEVLQLQAKNQDVLVKVIDRMEEGKIYIRYQYLPATKQIFIESTYRSKTETQFVKVEGLFSEKKFKKIIDEHSHRFIRSCRISGLKAGDNLSIYPENAIF